MTPKPRAPVFLAFLVLAAGTASVFAGDSVYGKVTRVKAGNLVTLDYGAGQYEILIAGVDIPQGSESAAKAFVEHLVLGKNARMRVVRRVGNAMMAQLLTDDPQIGIRDVALELSKARLAVRRKPLRPDSFYLYKYGELTLAEKEGREALIRTPTPAVTRTPTP